MTEKKTHLEKICKIRKWSPNGNQITSIISHFEIQIRNGEKLTLSDCQGVVSKYCPGTTFFFFDGLDNSDLNTLLQMVLKK